MPATADRSPLPQIDFLTYDYEFLDQIEHTISAVYCSNSVFSDHQGAYPLIGGSLEIHSSTDTNIIGETKQTLVGS